MYVCMYVCRYVCMYVCMYVRLSNSLRMLQLHSIEVFIDPSLFRGPTSSSKVHYLMYTCIVHI